MERLIKIISYSILLIIAALLTASMGNLFFSFENSETWIIIFKIFSYILMVLSISLIILHMVLTRHPHYDIWLIGVAGIVVSILGISGGLALGVG